MVMSPTKFFFLKKKKLFHLELVEDELDHLVVVGSLVDRVLHESERLIEDGEEHVDEHVRYRDRVTEEEERTQERTGQLQLKEVKPTKHHLKDTHRCVYE